MNAHRQRKRIRQGYPSYLTKLSYMAARVMGTFPLWVVEAVFPYAGPKRAGIEAENNRRPFLTLDAPTGFLQHL